jgi:DNA-binding NarL/FixJ family response regulator
MGRANECESVIRIVLVDDQELARAGLERILGSEDDMSIVAECDDGAQALDALEMHHPDVVVMDLRMRVMNGIEATRRIRDGEGPPVLILTTFDDDDALWGAIDAGAAGFVLKDASAQELIRAVRTVASGAAWIDPQVMPRVLAVYRSTVLPQARRQERAAELTDREHDVLRLIAGGATNAEIADALHVSAGTVKSHVGSIFTKLGVRDRAGAIVYAYQHGIASPPGPG